MKDGRFALLGRDIPRFAFIQLPSNTGFCFLTNAS
jgi:hypothetical protein